MNWFLFLSAIFLLVTLTLYTFARRKKINQDFKSILPHLFILLFIGIARLTVTALFAEQMDNPYIYPLTTLLGLIILLVILSFGVKVTAYLIFDFMFSKRQNIKYPRLIKDIVVIILYIIGILLILNYYLNIKVTVVLASSAVVTVVIGFALQDILGDLFSGIALNLEESLRIGDWIKTAEHEGKIEQFRWRSIKIRTIDNVLVLIPNQTASKKEVQRFGHPGEVFALRLDIGVSYKDSPDHVISTLLEVMNEVPPISKSPKPNIKIKSFDDFSILYELRFWLKDYSQKDFVKSEIRRKVWYAFKRNGIQIPFPVRDVYLQRSKKETADHLSEEEVIEILQKNEILNTISEKQLANLTADVEIKWYGKGEILIYEDEPGRYFYHILEGEAEVFKGNSVISTLHEDDYVGEISLFTGDRTTASVRVTRESKVLRLSSDKFRETVKLNIKMARKLSEVIALRKAQLSELTKQEDLSRKTAIHKETESIFLRIKKYFSV